MAVLEKIRVKFGILISVIIALALLSFIIDPSTLESALNTMSSKYDVGKIADKSISYTDFQADVDKYTTINQIITGSSVQNEQTQKEIRNAAWQELLDKYLFIKNAEAAGIRVGDKEMVALTSGEFASPIITGNPAFMDESGNYSPARLVEFVQNLDSDQSGQLRTYWNYLQNTIYTQQFYAKYGALFSASNIENKLMLEKDLADNNTTANFDYVLSYFPYVKDSTITVNSKEIQKYYDDHKKLFKQNANRDIEYVVFEVTPSDTDIQNTANAMADVYEEFLSTTSMKSFLLKNSDRPLSNYWYKAGELTSVNAQVNDAVFGGAETTPVIQDGNNFLAARVLATAQMPDSAFVKHILLQGDDAARIADSLVTVIKKGEDISSLAAVYSMDQSSSADGQLGSIGWMTQTYMIPGFEDVFNSTVGQPYTLKSQYGTHVVLVTRKTKPMEKKQVAILEKETLAGKETFNEYYAKANTFSTLTGGTYEGYKKALDSTKVYSHPMNGVTEATSSFGSIDNAKEITRWAFDNKKGKASGIITVNNNYFFVVALKEVHKEGYAPVQQVSGMIEARLYSEKMAEKTKADVAAKIGEGKTLEEIAGILGTSVESRTGVSFSSMSLAVEPALLGAVSVAKEGVVTGPVAGQMGVYYFKLISRETGNFFTEQDAKNVVAQKSQYASQMILPAMMEEAEVKDNRARFY